MTTVSILPIRNGDATTTYRAVAGQRQSSGRTVGAALDALTSQLGEEAAGTLIVVQHRRPDEFFSAAQQQRLEELMTRWRAARDAGAPLSAEDQSELERLVAAEVDATTARVAGPMPLDRDESER